MDPNAILRVTRKGAVKGGESLSTPEEKEKFEPKFKKRGRSSSKRRYLRRQLNVIDERREAVKARLEKEKKERAKALKEAREGREGCLCGRASCRLLGRWLTVLYLALACRTCPRLCPRPVSAQGQAGVMAPGRV